MPTYSSGFTPTTAASSSGEPLGSAPFIKGAFYTVDAYNSLSNIPIGLLSNNQLVWVEDAESVYQVTITEPDFVNTFSQTATWSEFSGFGGGSGGGSGDITAVVAGNGLLGGAFSGTANLSVGQGDGIITGSNSVSVRASSGITVDSNGVSLNTGSAHFTDGVGKSTIDGGDI